MNEPSHLIDIMATCVDVSGAAYPRQFDGQNITPLQGTSLVPLMTGSAIPSARRLFWEHEGNAAVRWGDWKLVRIGRGGSWELYDMKVDRTELQDLSAKNPALVSDLAASWEAWAVAAHVKPYPTGAAVPSRALEKD